MNFATLDLNLLRVFEAMLTERNVSKAATKLRQSQPATSNALARLRHALSDELFVRGRTGMVPTRRAELLSAPLTQALEQLRQVLSEPTAFNPHDETHFTLVASDHAQLVLLPALMRLVLGTSRARLRVLTPPRDFPSEGLERREIDLVIGAFDVAIGDQAPKGLKRQRLFSERYVIAGRVGHPAFKRALDVNWPRVHVAPRGGSKGRPDRHLKATQSVVLWVPHYAAVPGVLQSTDLLCALPERVAEAFSRQAPLDVRPLPFELEPLKVHQLWHPRRHDEPAHRWLRARVLEAARLGPTPDRHR